MKNKYHLLFVLLNIIIIIFLLFINPINETLSNYSKILTSDSLLLTDYISISSLSATFLNATLTTFMSYCFVKILKQEITAPVIAALFMIFGFAFFGKNPINALPIYIGVFLYSKINKLQVKSVIITLLFSSGIASIVSYIMFGLNLELYYSIPIAILTGTIIGYLIPVLNAHTIRFHQGYNLYASGFSMGLLSMLVFGILIALGFNIKSPDIVVDTSNQVLLYSIIFSLGILLILVSLFDRNVFKNYKK